MGFGTLAGAALGGGAGFLVGGPVGAGVGASLGGALGGSFGGELNRGANAEALYGGVDRNNFDVPGYNHGYRQMTGLANQYGGREAPQSQWSQHFRNRQIGLGQQFSQEAAGNGIGQRLIRQQAQGMADRGMQQQLGMAAGARPGQSAMATRNAMMNAGNMNSQVGGQSSQAMGQYQLGAMQNYGQFLGAARGQDEQTNMFNADMRLKQLGLNDQSQLEALRQRLQLQGMQQQGGQAYEGQRTQRYGAVMGTPTSGEQMLSGIGSALAFGFGKKA